MKIELEMTPEEARRLMGWPDVTALQKDALEEIKKRMKAALDASDPQTLLKAWMPAGAEGFEQFQKFLWDGALRAAGKKDAPKSSR